MPALEDKQLADIKAKHAGEDLRVLSALDEDIVVRSPPRAEWKRFRMMYADTGQRANALEALVYGCLVWPSATELGALFDRRPALAEVFGNRLADMAGINTEATEKKIVTRFNATKRDLGASADALTAFFRGEDSVDAEVGALVVADAIDSLRVVREFLTAKPKRRGGHG